MARQQRLLDQVFRLLGAAPRPHHPALVVGAKTRRELREQRAVGGRIAALACQHQRLQFGFMSSHAGAAGCSVGSPSAMGLPTAQHLLSMNFAISSGEEKVTAARSPSIPVGMIAGAPLSGPILV